MLFRSPSARLDGPLPIAGRCDDLPTPDQSIGFAAVETEPVIDRRHSEFAVWIVALLLAIIAGFAILWPVLSTPFYADDIFNSQHSAHIAASDQSVWSYSASGVRQWMDNEGRFFPVSSIEGVFLFDTVHDRGLYKVIQVATTFIAAALLAVFIAVLTRDRRLGLLALFLTIPGFQLRYWYDPIHSFGLLLPSLTIKIFGSLLLVLIGLRATHHRRAFGLFVAGGLVWTAALLQYEVAFVVCPVVFAVLWHERTSGRRRLWTAGTAILLPTFLLANYIATLRSSANPSPGYTTNWALEDLLPTAFYQLVGAVPGSAALFAGGVPGLFDLLLDIRLVGLIAAIAGGTGVAILLPMLRLPATSTAVALLAIGTAVFVFPAVPIASSLRWQSELGWGIAYLPAFAQSLGLVVLVLGAGCLIITVVSRSVGLGLIHLPPVGIRFTVRIIAGLSIALPLLVVGNGNQWVADQLAGLRHQQETTDAAISNGFFNLAGEGSTVVASVSPGGNEYINAAYVTWRGGPADLTVLREMPTTTEPCGQFRICDAEGRALYHFQEVVTDDGSVSFAIARIAGYTSNPEDPLVLLDEAAVFGSVERLPSCGDGDIVASGYWATSPCDGHPVAASLLGRWLTDATEEELHSGIGRLLEAAINAGFLDRVEGGATMLVMPGQHYSGAMVEWSGGPSGLRFAETLPDDMLPCGEAEFCTIDGRPIFVLRALEVDGDRILMLAPVAGHTGNPLDPLVVMNHITLFGPGRATPTCAMNDVATGSVPTTDDAWVTRLCTGPPSAASSFETWVAAGCTEGLAGWFICDDNDSRS